MGGEREYYPRGTWGPHPADGEEPWQWQRQTPAMPQQVRLNKSELRLEEILTKALERKAGLTERQKDYFRHWMFAYLEYCRRTNQLPNEEQSRMSFLERMGQKGRSSFVIQQADKAIRFLRKTIWGSLHSEAVSFGEGSGSGEIRGGRDGSEVWKRVLERMEREVRIRHYSSKTLKTYVHWIRGFAQFLSYRDPSGLKAGEAKSYLEYLAIERGIAASTQNQAFNALLFLFNNVLGIELEELTDTPRAKKSGYVPEVFSKEEVEKMFHLLEYPYDIFAQLLYGCGLRLGEGLNLRVQDLDLPLRKITVHRGKGGKCRRLVIPNRLVPPLTAHLGKVRKIYERDLEEGTAGVFLPEALERKYPKAAREWPWFWVFPGRKQTLLPQSGELKRYHLHETLIQKAIRNAVLESGIPKHASAHTFRHSYATHLLHMGVDIRTVKDWMGHEDVKTTQIYTQALQSLRSGPSSPLDWL